MMMNRFIQLDLALIRLKKDERGLALLEFALALPLFLTLALGGMELANLASSHMRVSQLAMTVADNAARVDSSIDESDIYEIFEGATLLGENLAFKSNGRIIISSLQDNGLTGSNAGQMINWQRCMGDLAKPSRYGVQGAGRTDASLAAGLGEVGRKIYAAPSTAIMFVEVVYNYQQLIPGDLVSREIRYETAFNVRNRDVFNISNSSSPALAVKACT
jgi:hypothetical protein